MRIYMQTPVMDGKPPRYYQLLLQQDLIEGWNVIREWGQQGSPGRVKHNHYEARDDALRAMLMIRDAQVKRGYQVMFVRGEETA